VLDAFIIDELRRREEEERDSQRPRLELPVDDRYLPPPANGGRDDDDDDDEDKPERGVVIIDL